MYDLITPIDLTILGEFPVLIISSYLGSGNDL